MNCFFIAFLLTASASIRKMLLSEPAGVNTELLQIEHSSTDTKIASYVSGANATLTVEGNYLTIEENGAFVIVIRDHTLFYPKDVFYVNDAPQTQFGGLGDGPGFFAGMQMPFEESNMDRAIRLSLQDVGSSDKENDDMAEAIRLSLQDANGDEEEEKSEGLGERKEQRERKEKSPEAKSSESSDSSSLHEMSSRRPRLTYSLSSESSKESKSSDSESQDGNVNNGRKSASNEEPDASIVISLSESGEEVENDSRDGAEKRKRQSSEETDHPPKRRRIEPEATASVPSTPTKTQSIEEDIVEQPSGRPMNLIERENVNVPFKKSKGVTVMLKEGDLVVTVVKMESSACINLSALLEGLFEVSSASNMTELAAIFPFGAAVHITGQFFQTFLSRKELEEKTNNTQQSYEISADQKFVIDAKVTFQGQPGGVRMSRPDSDELSVALNGSRKSEASAKMDKDGKSIRLVMSGGACTVLVRDGDIINTIGLPYSESQEPTAKPDHKHTENVPVQDGDVVILFVPTGDKAMSTLASWTMTVGYSSDEMKEYAQMAYKSLAPKSDVAVLITRISKAQQ